MKKPILSVYDSKAQVFSDPQTALNVDVAQRDFSRECSNPDSNLFHFGADFSLFQLGEFDNETGIITYYDQPINHGLAASFRIS